MRMKSLPMKLYDILELSCGTLQRSCIWYHYHILAIMLQIPLNKTSKPQKIWTEELVPLSFFSINVADSIKQNMVNKMLTAKNYGRSKYKFGSGFGKPAFSQPPPDTSRDLDFYMDNDSWAFFNILKINSSF